MTSAIGAARVLGNSLMALEGEGDAHILRSSLTTFIALAWVSSSDLNLDKGNQSVGGADMQVVCDVGNSLPCTLGDYTY